MNGAVLPLLYIPSLHVQELYLFKFITLCEHFPVWHYEIQSELFYGHAA
jgi:hypothetical protein